MLRSKEEISTIASLSFGFGEIGGIGAVDMQGHAAGDKKLDGGIRMSDCIV